MSTIKLTPEQLLHVSKQIEQGRQQLEGIRNDLTARIGFIQSQWAGATQERFFYDFQQSRSVLDRALESMVKSSQDLFAIAERFDQADQEQVSLGAVAGQIAAHIMMNHNISNTEEQRRMVYNPLFGVNMPASEAEDGMPGQKEFVKYWEQGGTYEEMRAGPKQPESGGVDIYDEQISAFKEGHHPVTGESIPAWQAAVSIGGLQAAKLVLAFSGTYNKGYKVPKEGLKFPNSKHEVSPGGYLSNSDNVMKSSNGGRWGAQDVHQYTQYKQTLLKKDVMSNSEVIIRGENLWDEKARKTLTSNGSKIEDWAKMTSKQQYETPYGKGEVHFYQNQKTGELSTFDLKLKVSKPRKLREDEDDLFWIIDLDGNFNITGVR
ncbi:WXG100 family type VII secretion target [Paenibacillus sp. 2003]|uniref:WXG100 family type VII secretion target n=1 Tax=Paenibacillus TaxID=44249 RepID=UPI0028660B0E|nr:WXG100 family type VII secretion target [Paenibacillus sp. 2003]MDR6718753.1 WXG100 family type VII secretion target [Paenibacillus sp. 2003]